MIYRDNEEMETTIVDKESLQKRYIGLHRGKVNENGSYYNGII